MTELLQMTRDELQQTFQEEVKTDPDYRWSNTTLIEKIEEAREINAAEKLRNAEREDQVRIAKEMREAQVVARGDFAAFAKTFSQSDRKDYANLARAVRWAQQVIAQHNEVAANLGNEFAKDPVNAMSWSMKYFSHAADYTMAQEFKYMFEHGVSVQDMIIMITRTMRQKALYPERSSSPTSDLMAQEQLRATTKLLGYLDGPEVI